ncbi:mandelate racemase/muconate lactonizing enzyme family protein [Rhodobacteraceae bacterium RKSG542]|uniref:mandelate racemase/muconate lactonizing enzyme family protein n=1 Tax=Pseudovibrio flavus TaxID=2529854 RepID=UPI0012BBC03C|nr:mandelate racemase/muconate lactonizing enzyme family protein [Pseudovibrio flavus]MTI17652.1 mandelate racemase/muconate lactonizing enzyme family protein [Pseudovibrio flavus]
MKITQVECFPLKIKPKQAYLGGSADVDAPDYYYRDEYRCVYSRKMETSLVKITTDNGLVGWGEALAPVVPQVVSEIIKNLFAPLLIGENPNKTNVLWSRMYDAMRDRGYLTGFMVDAIAAVDCALWDIRGKAVGLPVSELLGGAYRDGVDCYISGLPAPGIAGRVELAKSWKQKGFKAIKMALGYGVDEDIANLKAVREAVGPEVQLFIDAHWNYSVSDAVRLARRMEELDIRFFEAPLLPENVTGHAELRSKTMIPIAIGETERTRFEFQPFIDKRAVDIVQPDVGRVGITETMRIGYQAETHDIAIAPHLSVGLGPCIAASIHVACALPNTKILEFQPSVFEVANSILKAPITVEAGRYHLPSGPGLGVEVDEEIIKQHVLDYKNA